LTFNNEHVWNIFKKWPIISRIRRFPKNYNIIFKVLGIFSELFTAQLHVGLLNFDSSQKNLLIFQYFDVLGNHKEFMGSIWMANVSLNLQVPINICIQNAGMSRDKESKPELGTFPEAMGRL